MKFRHSIRAHAKGRYLAHLLLICYLLAIFGPAITGHLRNIVDDDTDLALQSPAVVSNIDEVAFLELSTESISLPLVDKNSLPIRAPPYTFRQSI
jgi:hypothetical protein